MKPIVRNILMVALMAVAVIVIVWFWEAPGKNLLSLFAGFFKMIFP